MRILLDSHALIWWLSDDPRLSAVARALIADVSNMVLVSSATAWELSTKVRLGKLVDATGVIPRLPDVLLERGMTELPVTVAHALEAGSLPGTHRDPFDRMLIAQSRIEQAPVVTIDPVFRSYDVDVIW